MEKKVTYLWWKIEAQVEAKHGHEQTQLFLKLLLANHSGITGHGSTFGMIRRLKTKLVQSKNDIIEQEKL